MPPEENVSRKQDWNFGPFNMQSSATTRSQATSMQFPYNLASYQGCLYSAWPWNEAIHTICMDKIQSLLPSGSCQSSVGPYQSGGIGYHNKNCLHSEYYWCADILHYKDKVSLMQVFQRHWHTGPYTKRDKPGYKATLHSYQSRVLTDTCRLQVVVKGGAPHS